MDFGDSRIPDRLWNKVHPEPNTGCWLWAASGVFGYGQLTDEHQKHWRAHRYFLYKETGVTGPHARHLCHTRACVNPDHLAWGTAQDNSDDAKRAGRGYAGRTHCPKGHPYDEGNTRIKKRAGQPDRRVCRTCDLDNARGYAYASRRRVWATPLAVDDPRHGNHNMYVSHKCRCGPCVDAYRTYRKNLPSRQPGYEAAQRRKKEEQ